MNGFEKIDQIERHPSIELSDEMIKERFVYREPFINDNLPDYIKKKYELAQSVCKESFTITIDNEPVKIMQKIEAPILEKQIKEKGMHQKKNKRKKCNE